MATKYKTIEALYVAPIWNSDYNTITFPEHLRLVPAVSGFLVHPTSGSHHQYERVDSVSQPNIFKLVAEQINGGLEPFPHHGSLAPNNKDQCVIDSDYDNINDIDNSESYKYPTVTKVTSCDKHLKSKVIEMDPLMEADSDNEDDPTKLLNQWLGELNSLKKGLDKNVEGSGSSMRQEYQELDLAEKKKKYRCSLINLDTSQDEELDAILGELTVLESQFDQELVLDQEKRSSAAAIAQNGGVNGSSNANGGGSKTSAERSPVSPAESDRSSSNITDLGIHSNTHSRSSSGSDEMKHTGQLIRRGGGEAGTGGGRTESPDTDSAFCDNLSVLSSCSAASSSKTGQSLGVPSSVHCLTKEEQEAKIKAEKIKLAIEKIKEASVKKLFIKVFTSDGSAKSLLVDEKMSVGHVTRILAEKNHVQLDPKWALVELVPDLYMERVYEDHEQLVDNCLLWKVDSKNTLWFIERPEKFDLFLRPEVYLLGTSSSQKDDQMEEHSRQELLEEYFSSSGVGAPQLEGNIYLKADSKKSWKKFYFVLRSSGMYYAPKGKKSSKDLVCLTTFDVNQVYYGVGWKNKYKAPTDYCFGIKHPQIQAKNPKYIKYLCVETQRELHQWVTGIRIAKNGKSLYENYRGIVEEITHADIDILTSKRFSVNSSNGLHITNANGVNGPEKQENGIQSPARTPSSENKSLASALSSGFESDLSNGSSKQDVSKLNQSLETDEGCSGVGSGSNGGNDSSEKISAGLTPVGTLERSFKLRRSFSRSSRSSSGSGCMSDKSGAELGFESDFPLGGTIKKRPTTTPRLPLTNTTWGLVKESDENDDEDLGGAGGVVGVGAGGTLLRRAVRNSLPRKPKENGGDVVDFAPAPQQVISPPTRLTEAPMADLNSVDDPLSSAFERSLSSMSEDENLPLPPPPRMDSIQSLDQIDQLPPPPADIYNTTNEILGNSSHQESNHYHVSPVSSPMHAAKLTSLPPSGPSGPMGRFPGSPKPATAVGKKPTAPIQKSSRRISFDDNVQMIEAPSSPTSPKYSTMQNLKEKAIAKFTPTPPYRGNPGKLMFNGDESTNTNSLPRSFLSDLQKVMNKKWQVAEKCRADTETTPHEVLGFRDEPVKNMDKQGLYSQKSAIGAWVLESQQYTPEELEVPEYSGPQQVPYQDPYSGNKTYTQQHERSYVMAGGRQPEASPSHVMMHRQQQDPQLHSVSRQESPSQFHRQQQESPGSPYHHQQLRHLQESPSPGAGGHYGHHQQQYPQHRQESPYAGYPHPHHPHPPHHMMPGHSPQSPQHHLVHHHVHHAASPVHHGSPLHHGASPVHHGAASPLHHFHHGAGLPPPHSPQHNGNHSPASSSSGGASSTSIGHTHQPVVLIEPEPNYVDPGRMRANKGNKRPPPPPRRNDNTQLTASGY